MRMRSTAMDVIRNGCKSMCDEITVGPIDTFSSIDKATGSKVKQSDVFTVSVNDSSDGGGGIRFKLPLAYLTPGVHYTCSFVLLSMNPASPEQSLWADVCDDADIGPFSLGHVEFQFSRSNYSNVYRFVDVWLGEEYVGGTFRITNFQVFAQ